jgi:hypothetical protein
VIEGSVQVHIDIPKPVDDPAGANQTVTVFITPPWNVEQATVDLGDGWTVAQGPPPIDNGTKVLRISGPMSALPKTWDGTITGRKTLTAETDYLGQLSATVTWAGLAQGAPAYAPLAAPVVFDATFTDLAISVSGDPVVKWRDPADGLYKPWPDRIGGGGGSTPTVTEGETAPTAPVEGDIWINSLGPKVWNGTAWATLGPTVWYAQERPFVDGPEGTYWIRPPDVTGAADIMPTDWRTNMPRWQWAGFGYPQPGGAFTAVAEGIQAGVATSGNLAIIQFDPHYERTLLADSRCGTTTRWLTASGWCGRSLVTPP